MILGDRNLATELRDDLAIASPLLPRVWVDGAVEVRPSTEARARWRHHYNSYSRSCTITHEGVALLRVQEVDATYQVEVVADFLALAEQDP